MVKLAVVGEEIGGQIVLQVAAKVISIRQAGAEMLREGIAHARRNGVFNVIAQARSRAGGGVAARVINVQNPSAQIKTQLLGGIPVVVEIIGAVECRDLAGAGNPLPLLDRKSTRLARSEERRVGKEC